MKAITYLISPFQSFYHGLLNKTIILPWGKWEEILQSQLLMLSHFTTHGMGWLDRQHLLLKTGVKTTVPHPTIRTHTYTLWGYFLVLSDMRTDKKT